MSKKTEIIEELEQRIKALETQNKHLVNMIGHAAEYFDKIEVYVQELLNPIHLASDIFKNTVEQLKTEPKE